MKKLITLVAAASLIASPFALADNGAPSNPNDVLHQIPNNGGNTTVAEAATSPSTTPSNEMPSQPLTEPTAKPMKGKHHHKHHNKHKHHACHTHHKKHHAENMSNAAPVAAPKAPEQPAPTTVAAANEQPNEIVIGPEASAT
jgi:hypothetical protein